MFLTRLALTYGHLIAIGLFSLPFSLVRAPRASRVPQHHVPHITQAGRLSS